MYSLKKGNSQGKRRTSTPRRSTSIRLSPPTAARSALMRRVRLAGTKPELAVQAALRTLGVRFRSNVARLPGSPDIANATKGFALFVHGCFWHRHKGCRRTTSPAKNTAFWQAKFASNLARDRQKVRELRNLGFRVYTIWECEAQNAEQLLTTLRRKLKRELEARHE